MLYTDALLEVRARLQELAADFWLDNELYRAINEGVNRFAQEEKWPYLYTVASGIPLVASTEELELQDGVGYERHFNLMLFFEGDNRPRMPRRVHPAEGSKLRMSYYTDAGEPLAYYLYSQADSGTNEVQSITNTGATSGTFGITFDGQSTAVFSRGSTAMQIQVQLITLSNIGAADVYAWGGPLGTAPVYVRFQRDLGGADVPAMTLNAVSTDMSVATITTGGTPSGQFVTTVRLVPALTRNCTIEYQYIRDPITTSSPTIQHLDVPEEYAMGVVAYATGHAFLKELQFSQKAEEQFALYAKIVGDAKRESRKITPDRGLTWGRNEPEYGYMDDDTLLAIQTPPILGP
jgi:hypothetical protein